MTTHNGTKNFNQLLNRVEYYYFNNETHYDHNKLQERWSLYVDIFNQLLTLDKLVYLPELEYRIFDGDNINDILVSFIKNDDDLYHMLYPYINLLKEYSDLDEIKIFL